LSCGSKIREIVLEGLPRATMTFTMALAPHFIHTPPEENGRRSSWTRGVPCLKGQHATISGSCLVYRVRFEGASIAPKKAAMGRAQTQLEPITIQQQIDVVLPTESYRSEMKTFRRGLANATPAPLAFSVMFQLQRLVQNAKLRLSFVLALLHAVYKLQSRSGPRIRAYSVRYIWNRLPHLCLQTDTARMDLDGFVTMLHGQEGCLRDGVASQYENPNLKNRANIHRVVFTPTDMQLSGPGPEDYNRVLRKYRRHHEYFVRVMFWNEDHERLRFSPQWSNDVTYSERFKSILNEGFSIAGRRFNFLGFSHSSLRAQSCWFMAPSIHEGSRLYDRQLINGLGDFSEILCPAKCAARIGQAFSETPVAITLRKQVAKMMPDVERNGRIFSDGVGTMSQALLEKI
jgi:hypothetical protein